MFKLNNVLLSEVFHGDHPDYEVIEFGDWDDEGKYSITINIIKHKGKTYSMWASRSGSYFTDYDYEYSDELMPVKQIEVTVNKWVKDADHPN